MFSISGAGLAVQEHEQADRRDGVAAVDLAFADHALHLLEGEVLQLGHQLLVRVTGQLGPARQVDVTDAHGGEVRRHGRVVADLAKGLVRDDHGTGLLLCLAAGSILTGLAEVGEPARDLPATAAEGLDVGLGPVRGPGLLVVGLRAGHLLQADAALSVDGEEHSTALLRSQDLVVHRRPVGVADPHVEDLRKPRIADSDRPVAAGPSRRLAELGVIEGTNSSKVHGFIPYLEPTLHVIAVEPNSLDGPR